MKPPFFVIRNKHTSSCNDPPAVDNDVEGKYFGYFENRQGEQWVFVYDPVEKTGELRGGDIGCDTVVAVRDGRPSIVLGEAEVLWLQACWKAATGTA
jgi:hypothetical protein